MSFGCTSNPFFVPLCSHEQEKQRQSLLESVGLQMTALVEELEQHKALVAQKEAAVAKWQQEAEAAREITSHAAKVLDLAAAARCSLLRLPLRFIPRVFPVLPMHHRLSSTLS